ncbi:hypothetical protein TrispH2_000858 [Trichoplax sp. H2]|uniref:BZIP domain-containing protein n=1 Tax=Trichoplax adhaerens TaxID=10228 RepID=B3S7U6_TRIAD|nr:predicted protein [Trichoplax adhaerens]EDV21255.1 predicted protein [Trichoplax adhaerens]RDD47638.1 hypothetical protein TrispH2_000858 [Trichoplax sp. H2]|eukprot:XP_002116222.1 predicted protein [Trichoplax adhaerens]
MNSNNDIDDLDYLVEFPIRDTSEDYVGIENYSNCNYDPPLYHFMEIRSENSDFNNNIADISREKGNKSKDKVSDKDKFARFGLCDKVLENIKVPDLNKLLREELKMPPDEILQIKGRRRLLKNCKSAKKSRKNKTDKVKCLEDKLEDVLQKYHQQLQEVINLRKAIREINDVNRTLICWIALLYVRTNLR